MEEWKPWPQNTNYEISTEGRVRNKHGRILKQTKHNSYFQIELRVSVNTPKTLLVHRLVAETFLEGWNESCIVDHINGIRTDNNVKNLRITNSIGNTIYKNNNNAPIYKKVNELIQKKGYDYVYNLLQKEFNNLDV